MSNFYVTTGRAEVTNEAENGDLVFCIVPDDISIEVWEREGDDWIYHQSFQSPTLHESLKGKRIRFLEDELKKLQKGGKNE